MIVIVIVIVISPPPSLTPCTPQQTRFQQMSDSIIGRIDEMGTRIDDLEKSIGDLIQQAGLEEVDMASKQPTTNN